MNIKGILFDVNGTMVDIQTDEGYEEIYRGISHYLTYQGIYRHRWEIRDEYYRIMDEQKLASGEEYPEFDAAALWREFLRRQEASINIPESKLDHMPLFLAEMYRGISRFRLQLYPDVISVLDELKSRFPLAVVSDGQSAWARSEMQALGIEDYFDPILISGDFGYRKPDRRLFETALNRLGLLPEETLFVGNDMFHDIHGAKRLGLKTVFFSSNQGRKQMEGVDPDYIIYNFKELLSAVEFFEKN